MILSLSILCFRNTLVASKNWFLIPSWQMGITHYDSVFVFGKRFMILLIGILKGQIFLLMHMELSSLLTLGWRNMWASIFLLHWVSYNLLFDSNTEFLPFIFPYLLKIYFFSAFGTCNWSFLERQPILDGSWGILDIFSCYTFGKWFSLLVKIWIPILLL